LMAINKTPTKERRLTKITLIKEYIRGSIGYSYFITKKEMRLPIYHHVP